MRVVNVKYREVNDPSILYTGHNSYGWKASPVANPFATLKSEDKAPYKVEDPVEAYRHLLWAVINKKETFEYENITYKTTFSFDDLIQFMDRLNFDSVLGCWCLDRNYQVQPEYPLHCHAEVLIRAWLFLQKNPLFMV